MKRRKSNHRQAATSSEPTMIEVIASNKQTFSQRRRSCRRAATSSSSSGVLIIMGQAIQLLIVMNLLFVASGGWWRASETTATTTVALGPFALVEAVSVQRLNVPDLVVIDQLNQKQPQLPGKSIDSQQPPQRHRTAQEIAATNSNQQQPEAASLINSQDLSAATNSEQQQITFECLVSFDKRKDKNLIVKWHHDDRIEPIYQWIPELNKRSIAPQYRAYIAPIVSPSASSTQASAQSLEGGGGGSGASPSGGQNATTSSSANPNQIQLLEAGFRLVRPSKELGGKYTCSAISTQNDDSKWKKMIVYTPPRAFRFNASRTDIGAQLASQRERLIQLTQPALVGGAGSTSNNHQRSQEHQLPLAYRMRGFESQISTTISPQMYSTIDYVNVNQQRAKASSSSSAASSSPWLLSPPTMSPHLAELAASGGTAAASRQQHQSVPPVVASASGSRQSKQPSAQLNGVKLVCDIDQVFPVPEVSIYRLAKLDGSHPDKLAKLDTRIERNSQTGLYHVQVISILEDDELQMKYGLNEPVYFECLIALTNLELSKYADNKRSIVYRPALMTNSLENNIQTSEDVNHLEQVGNSAAWKPIPPKSHLLLLAYLIITLALMSAGWPPTVRP